MIMQVWCGYLNSTFMHNYFAIHKPFFQDVFADYQSPQNTLFQATEFQATLFQATEFQATEFQATEFQATEFQATLSHVTGLSPDHNSWLAIVPVLADSDEEPVTAA